MEVRLFRKDGEERDIAIIARLSRGIKENMLGERVKNFFKQLLIRNEMTPFEFCGLVFSIRCSRACHSQFLQYRTASRLTRSLRFTKPLELDNPKLLEVIPEGFRRTYAREALKEYQFQTENGVLFEDARGILPLDTQTEFYWANDLRNILHFLEERLHTSAQGEIRQAAEKMLDITRKAFPTVIGAWEEIRNDS